jgi:DNA-binding XRE family transcriptional regulator
MQKTLRTGLSFNAYYLRTETGTVYWFPQISDHRFSVPAGSELAEAAQQALTTTLMEQLSNVDVVPTWPTFYERQSAEWITVRPSPELALAIQVRRLRKHKAWGVEELATKLGVTDQDVEMIEDPAASKPTPEILDAIKACLGSEPLMIGFH